MDSLKEDILFFKYDLHEYTNSTQGKAVEKALETHDIQKIDRALDDYFKARSNNCFFYDKPQDKINGMRLDKASSKLFFSSFL